MSLKLILFVLVLVLVFSSNSIYCENLLKPIEESSDVEAVSQVLLDVADEFLLNEKIEFDIYVLKELPQFSAQIFDNFLAKINEKFTKIEINFHKKFFAEEHPLIHHSAFLFLESIESFEYVAKFLDYERFQNQASKFFVFVPNLTFAQLESHWIMEMYSFLSVYSGGIFSYSNFILNENDSVSLSTVDWFSPKGCNSPHLMELNSFDKKLIKWKSELKNYEKFLQYHGCELVQMLPVPSPEHANYFPSGYADVNIEQTRFDVYGITPIIFNSAAKFYNFTVDYQPVKTSRRTMTLMIPKFVSPVSINRTFKRPHVFFLPQPIGKSSEHVRASLPITDIKMYVFVTPAEAYTPYEKLFLPFDLETWILLAITFTITILAILVINRLSKSTQQVVYGHKVENPFWNVVSIFFGIQQTRLPNENFSRFILIFFIYFCLIFRTCYQNKLFEFMTSEPRRSPPKTIEDLIDRNYSAYSTVTSDILESVHDKHERRLKIEHSEIFDYSKGFVSQSQNTSAKMALCVDEIFLNYFELKTRRSHDWNQLNDPLYTSHEAFTFYQFSFYFRMFKKTIDQLIDTGVMKHLIDNHYLMKRKFARSKSGPKVLSMDDLSFGFNIWLGFCCISFAAFVAEKIFNLMRRKQKIKFAKVYPLIADEDECHIVLKPETLKKFRIKKIIQEIHQNNENKITVAVEVHRSMNSHNNHPQHSILSGSHSQYSTDRSSPKDSENINPQPQKELHNKLQNGNIQDVVNRISLLEIIDI